MTKRSHSKISVASYGEFLRELGSEVNTNKRFKHIQYNQSFALEKLDSVDDPTELLRYCFQQCVDRTMAKSRQEGMECDQLGVTISSPLLSYDIWTPLRPITDNTVDAILNTFLKVMQSQTAEGIYGEPFTVTVTGVRAQDLPTRRTTVGRGRKNYVQKIVSNIEDACILQIKNTDRYCLFYALELMRIHVSNEMTRQRFFEYKTNFERQRTAVTQMMRNAKIPRNLPDYILEEWGPVVQQYYDDTYGPGTYINYFQFLS